MAREEERERKRERRQPEQRDRGAQIATATITPTPIRRTAGTQPENTAPSSAPTAGAAAIRPRPPVPP
jgi:hypothetical protein